MSARPRTWAVIAGGGTAGHVTPALAVAGVLVARGHEATSIRFVGSRRGVERRMVPDAGFAVTLLPGRGIARRLAWSNVSAIGSIALATFLAILLFARRRPAVVLSVGGYAAVPCVVAAVIWRVPLIVAEANAVPGQANRWAARFARASAVSFPDTALPRAVVTGNPVRPEIVAVERTDGARAAARRVLGLPADRLVIAVAGGSLGSRRINEAVWGLVTEWADRQDVAIRHAVGTRDWDEAGRPVPLGVGLLYQAVEYEDRMALVYTAADLGVFRAGGTTMAELTVVGLPSVLVPLPGAPGDHQTKGARRLEAAGAAVVVGDRDLDARRLADVLEPLLADPERRRVMGSAAAALGRPRAAVAIAELVEMHSHGR